MAEEQSPYAEAVALRDAGVESDAIAAKLRARGLDAEAVALLLNAVGVRAVEIPLPRVDPSREPQVVVSLAPPGSSCPRCGVFLEADAWVPVLGKAYCQACAARPDVNYPKAYREAHWGQRDGWAWFYGVTGILLLLLGAITLGNSVPAGLLLIVNGAASVMFWSGATAGRPVLVGVSVLSVLLSTLLGSPPNVFGIIFLVSAMRSARTKLFFELEVSEADLAEAWMAQHDNRPAQYARAIGLIASATMLTWAGSWKFAFVTLGLGSLAVLLGVIGLRQVKPDATPPVGRKSAALTGLISGAVATLAGAVWAVLNGIVWR